MLTTTMKMRVNDLKHASGEQLLLMVVFGSASLKERIDHELDRRAVTGIFRVPSGTSHATPTINGHAA